MASACRAGKRNSYESGLRVPLLIRFPDGSRAGTTDDRLISFLDFAPTILTLTGLKIPDHLRGYPFLGPAKTDPPEVRLRNAGSGGRVH
jgi:arylsulfatase A-like enzyme